MIAWIFDVDGVLTNLTAEKIVLSQIPRIINNKLMAGEPVSFISGRSLAWLHQTTLSKLTLNKKGAQNLFIAAEFGGVLATYEDNNLVSSVNNSYKVDQTVKEKAQEIIEKYSDSIEIERKEMFFTSKIKSGASLEDFKRAQQKAVEELKTLISSLQTDKLEVQSDSIGLSIRNKNANKSNCIKDLLSWLDDRGLRPDKYIVFGDSPSDLEMADELISQKLNFEFIYVGDSLETKPEFELTYTNKKHDEGTLEYLESH